MPSQSFTFEYGEDGDQYTTDSVGDKLDFIVTGGANSPFGTNIPTSFSVTFSRGDVFANFQDNVTIEWQLRFKINGGWYEVHSATSITNKANSNFNISNRSLPSNVASLLQKYQIEKLALYHDGDNDYRGITATSDATGTCTIEYTISSGSGGSGESSGSGSGESGGSSGSGTENDTIVTNTSATVQCYINDTWTKCSVLYYNGENWISCVPYYCDGENWIECGC